MKQPLLNAVREFLRMRQPLRNHLDYLREKCIGYLRTGGDTGDEEYKRLERALAVAAHWHHVIHGAW